MELSIENFRNIDIEQLIPGSFVDPQRWRENKRKLIELKVFVDEMMRIATNLDNQIPEKLAANAHGYANGIITFLTQIADQGKGNAQEILSLKEGTLKNIERFYRECIDKESNQPNQIGFLETFNTIKNLERHNWEKDLSDINKMKNEATSAKASIDTILTESQRKAATSTMANYAEIFGRESKANYDRSRVWLITGILLILIFLIPLLFTNWYEKLPTEDVLADGKLIKYNLSYLIIKVLIFAIQIFLISFSFKQYSICMHLMTINKHRQNGLDSFKLFSESISKDNTTLLHELMLQLSKAIYEQTSTGYISVKTKV
jgi:hypothetical protein